MSCRPVLLLFLALLFLMVPVSSVQVYYTSSWDSSFSSSQSLYVDVNNSGYSSIASVILNSGSSSWRTEVDTFTNRSVTNNNGIVDFRVRTVDGASHTFSYDFGQGVTAITGNVTWQVKWTDLDDIYAYDWKIWVYVDDVEFNQPEPDVPVYDGSGNVYFSQNSYSYNQTPRLYFDMTDYVDTIGTCNRYDPFLQDPNDYMSWFQVNFMSGYWITSYEVRFYEADCYNGQFYDVTSYPFHSYDISDIDYDSLGPLYYYDVFSPLRGRWIRGELVRHIDYFYGLNPDIFSGYYLNSIDTVIDRDYAYCYDLGQFVYVPPEQEPEIQLPDEPQQPNSTIEYPVAPPGQIPNYTPPQPVPGNESTVGSSYLSDYYQGLDSIIQPVNDTVSGVLSFVVSPLGTLGGSVLTMNNYLNSSLSDALYYVSPVSLIFDAVFYAIPDKVEFLFQLSLILTGVLVILRWH